MRKVEDYLKHADECRAMLSRSRTDDERKMLINMAETWESLAKERAQQLAQHKRIADLAGFDVLQDSK